MNRASSLKFPHAKQDFFITLNQRVNDYFKTNHISRHANGEMVVKTIVMLLMYFIPYALILSGVATGVWGFLGLFALMGFGLAGIGLSIMHDANHGAYSNKAWVNNLLGYTLNVVGGNALNWKIQHNVLHHTYTNVHDADEDISPRGVIRMHPKSEWKFMHRFQHLYAWFLYGLMTFVWIFIKDYVRLVRYQQEGMLKKQKVNAVREWIILFITKLTYYAYILIIPYLLLPYSFGIIFLGVFIMHYIAGFILAIIFQPAHVIDGTTYPEPDDNGVLENTWAIHQIRTTTNFANKSRLLSWYVGGLNFQIEHHLFPNVCHVHYKKISAIVKQTAEEFGLPYRSAPTFLDAIVGHARLLKQLGQKPAYAAA
jgi:linoleoyl-CoA desaturase